MKPENLIKRYALKNKNNLDYFSSILLYNLVYVKRHKTLYLFDVVFNDDLSDFEIKIINKSSKETLDEQLHEMFIFTRELDSSFDYQTIELIEKTGYKNSDNEVINIKLAYLKEINNKFKLIDIDNNCKGEIKII